LEVKLKIKNFGWYFLKGGGRGEGGGAAPTNTQVQDGSHHTQQLIH